MIDPGHAYELAHLDEQHSPTLSQVGHLVFVKRVGDGFPGNEPPAHPGVTTQEVLRALIDRTKYVNGQVHAELNHDVLEHLRQALYQLEVRAHQRRGKVLPFRRWATGLDAVGGVRHDVENEPTCRTCGHIRCGEVHP